ncbi:unnamed protein product [Mytilus edulis]|uniref:Uncharacterized protein n=1 Tax=Mytilus edulis TaxID=6550 RepID=A0A8S3V8J3_MYTED|nr:unnamed protein product [Mytilus edulis]
MVVLLIAFYGYTIEQRIIAGIQFSKDRNELKEESKSGFFKKQTIAHRKELEEKILVLHEINKFCRKESHEMTENMAELINETVTCGSEWVKQLETNEQGTVVTGSKETLRQDILSGAKVRISFGNHYADTQFTSILNDEVCVQSLFHISKNGWDKHETDAYWWFLYVCSTGNVHMSRWYVGSQTQPSTPETKAKYSVKWFTRQLSSDSNLKTPFLCNSDSGSVSCGNIQHLTRAVANGAEIHVTNVYGKRAEALEFSNIAYSKAETKVAGTHLWHVSQSIVGNHIEFQQNAYWWFNLWSTDGTRDMSRWSVGEHTDRGHSNDKVSMKWFADTSILVGKRVRLVYSDNTYGIEADQLVVRNGHVTAQVLGHVSKANLQKFQDNAYWYWQNVATTGNVETIRYNVGSHTNRGSSNDRQATKWFIDSRPWVHAYSNSETGVTTHGSKASLIQGVKAGKMLRYIIKSTTRNQQNNDYIAVFNADNADLSPDGNNLGAQHIRSIGLTGDGLYNVAFGSKPYWNFMIATTAGKLDETRWTVGEHQSQGHYNSNSAIDWFVS